MERAQTAKGLLTGAYRRSDSDRHAYSQGVFAEHSPMTDYLAERRRQTSATDAEDTQTAAATSSSASVIGAIQRDEDEPPEQLYRTH